MAKKTTAPRTASWLTVGTTLAWVLTGLVGVAPAGAVPARPAPTNPPRPSPLASLLRLLAPPPTTTVAPRPATTTTTTVVVSSLDVGASGGAVRALEQRLDALHYFVGQLDDSYDDDTAQAVMAFQKVSGMARTGTVDQGVWSALQTAADPAPLVPDAGPHRVEVDLARQVLLLYDGGRLAKIIAVSSGTSATPTPTGDFSIYSKSVGWETSALGQLYNSQYFVGGYAIHGSRSVPEYPASHGCVRLPMTAADWFPDQVPIGTPVYVR